jgi:hypothetical protein
MRIDWMRDDCMYCERASRVPGFTCAHGQRNAHTCRTISKVLFSLSRDAKNDNCAAHRALAGHVHLRVQMNLTVNGVLSFF